MNEGTTQQSKETELDDTPTPAPWEAVHFCKEDGTPIETVEDVIETMGASAIKMKTPVLYGVTEAKSDDYLVICYTGNGPKGRVNAEMIAHACNSYAQLLKDQEDLVDMLFSATNGLESYVKAANPDHPFIAQARALLARLSPPKE